MKIDVKDDFDLNKIIYSGQCFRPCLIDDNTYRFIKGDKVLYIKDNEVLCSYDDWYNVWADYFDLDTNYEAIRKSILKDDQYLLKAAQIGKGIRILKQDYFEMVISFIISQRKSIPAIRSSIEKICDRFGRTMDTDFGKVKLFPTPEELSKASEAELSECGLGYRVPYIMESCRRINLGELNLDSISKLSDDDLYEKLISLYGVGAKVANCISLFGYHRIKRAPIDTWIKKVIDNEYNGENPFLNYPEYAGIMQQYMFYAAMTKSI